MALEVPRVDLTKLTPIFGWDQHEATLPGGVKRIQLLVRCPKGHICNLDEHVVKLDGVVQPSVACTKCEFHDTIRLLDFVGDSYTPPAT